MSLERDFNEWRIRNERRKKESKVVESKYNIVFEYYEPWTEEDENYEMILQTTDKIIEEFRELVFLNKQELFFLMRKKGFQTAYFNGKVVWKMKFIADEII